MTSPHQPPTPPVIRQRAADPAWVAALIQEGVHPLLARIFAARGVHSKAELDSALASLLNPKPMSNIEEAAAALSQAIGQGQHLLVVADFDADGATACALAIRGLRRFGARVDFLVPDRFVFGYGLTPALVDHAHRLYEHDPVDWIITVDNGISSVTGVERAQALGMQVLVTDHHLPGKTLPNTLIVNPNLPGCPFGSKNLAGVGVMFYVLMALRAHVRDVLQWPAEKIPRLDDLLPIVALGTVADVVTLDANNRRLVAQGLQRLRKGNSFAGLNALFAVSGLDVRQATSSHLGFSIGPRINAAGRLGDMSVGIQCLIEDDFDQAMALASELDAMNQERREIESQAREEAAAQALARFQELAPQLQQSPGLGIVLHDANWHQGVIGLIAGKLKEQFYRPTIVLTNDGDSGRVKGSCRSIPGVHIRDVLERVDTLNPGLLLAFGGHAMAAGLSLMAADLPRFTEEFQRVLSSTVDAATLQQTLDMDGPLAATDMRLDLAYLLADQVWGQGFPAPVFVNEFRVISQRRLKERHLKLLLALEGETKSAGIEAIWFNAAADLPGRAKLAYRLSSNEWQGRSSLQLEVVGVA